MIDVNFVSVDKLPHDHFFVSVYKEAIAFLKKWKEKYVIDWDPSRGRNHYPEDPKSRIEFPSQESFPVTTTYYCDKGDASVSFYTQSRPGPDGTKIYSDRSIKFMGKEVLSVDKHLDRIFFMLIVSPQRPDITELQKWQNTQKTLIPVYNLVDTEKKSLGVVKIEEMITKAKAKIFGDAPVEDAVLRMIAGTYEIPQADTKSIAEVKHALNNFLFTKDRFGEYNVETLKEFIQMASKSSDTVGLSRLSVGALVQKAVDKNIIRRMKADNKIKRVGGWYFLTEDGDAGDFICSVPIGKKQNDVLVEYLVNNKDVLHALEASFAE